jgi:hypothetical protein
MRDDFESDLDARWTSTRLGGGDVASASSILRLSFERAEEEHYTDAQIDDYAKLRRSHYPWRPPLRLEVRARASHPPAHPKGTGGRFALVGTAGFGFWNLPFSTKGDVLRLPEAVWFFYASPPSRMELVPGVPGWGWKAQVVHAHRLGALVATGPTALSALWSRLSGHEDAAARWVQRLAGAQEAQLTNDPREWATYEIDWRAERAIFRVNGAAVLIAPNPPPGPLGFVAWVDNQYAVATPRGELRFGTIATEREWLELDYIRIHATDM